MMHNAEISGFIEDAIDEDSELHRIIGFIEARLELAVHDALCKVFSKETQHPLWTSLFQLSTLILKRIECAVRIAERVCKWCVASSRTSDH